MCYVYVCHKSAVVAPAPHNCEASPPLAAAELLLEPSAEPQRVSPAYDGHVWLEDSDDEDATSELAVAEPEPA